MKAMVLNRYGSPDVLHMADVDKPAPGDSDLLVKVEASSVNALDWHFMRGKPFLVRLQYGFFSPKHHIMGYDIAGTVADVGRSVTRFKTGDKVFGGLGFTLGGFAEYACIPEGAFVAPMPANISFEQAAAVPGAGVAALIGLQDRGGLKTGQRVLINGAAGGVGTSSVLIAKAMGAEVTAVCSTRNIEMVKRLGADHAIDYTKEDFTRSGIEYDLLLDNVGNRTAADMLRVIRRGGTSVIVGFTNMGLMLRQTILGPRAAKSRGITWSKPESREPGREHAETLAELLADGKMIPEIETTYGLDELPDAMRHIETGHARAKIVVKI